MAERVHLHALLRHEQGGVRALLLFLGGLLVSLAGSSSLTWAGADRASLHPLTVRSAIGLCAHARATSTSSSRVLVASPRVWVQGYFLRVIGNGYAIAGEPGALYDHPARPTRLGEPAAGGLAVGVPSQQVPHGIPSARWVQLHGRLNCARFPGQILMVDAWLAWRR